ncbi:MAG: InlB B-repeat-containing protein [Salinivirgaceae bacterium]|nr:InlB B-repeat-containing protein [Salinivirgaceae bacterium]
MKKLFLLTMALVLATLTGAWAATVNFADPLTNGHEGQGTIYYQLNTDTKEATVVAGTWQYTKNIFIPDEVEYNGEPYAVTKIAAYAFRNSYDLDMVHLGANVHTIESNAFYMCGTTDRPVTINFDAKGLEVLQSNAINQVVLSPNRGDSIVFGKNVKQLGDASATSTSNWYSWGTRLGVRYYGVEEGNAYFCSVDGVLYDKDKTRLISYPRSNSATSFVIPSSVTTVCTYAFQNVQNITTITGGENVVRIGSVVSGSITSFPVGPKVTSMAPSAFMYCDYAFLPVVDDANPRFKLKGSPQTGYALYDYNYTVKNDATVYIALCRYFRTVNVATFKIPADVTYIADYAFYSHPYVKYIDFQDCTGLRSSKIAGTAFHSTTYSVQFLNADNIFANVDGVLYTDDKKTMVIYGSNVTMPNYVMPAETKTIPVSAIKPNNYVKTFAINSVCNSINTEYLDNMYELERYSVAADNSTYYTDTCGVLYTKTTLLSYPRANTRSYYKVADGTTQLNVRAFYRNRFLKVLDLGSSIKSVVNGNNNTLASMAGLEAIKVSTMVPPTVMTTSFSTTQLTTGKIKLYVPLDEGATDIYGNASVWNKFYIIRDTSQFETDIRNIDVDYAIHHYKQNIDDDDYVKAETNNTKGKLLSTTAVSARTDDDYAGFDAQPFSQITLNNSNLSVNIYYNRKYFSVTWMNGSTQISTKSYRYRAPFLADKPADPTPEAGKHFVGWNTVSDATVALSFNGSEQVMGNTTYYAIFADNASKKYHVEHYQQNADDDGYTIIDADTEEDSKPFGSQTTATAKSYEGFTAQPFSQLAVAEDESTVVKIYYNRNEYTVTWKNGSATVLSDSYKYGSALQVPADPAAPAATKHFVGWNTNATAVTAMPVATQTVPIDGATYYAIFAENDSKQYIVEHYLQNVDGQTYPATPFETETGAGLIGAETEATTNTYPGFTAPATITQQTITASGATVVIKYTRNKYDVVWKKGTETLSTNANVLFGAAIQAPTDPTAEAGSHFVGWNSDSQATSAMNMAGQTVTVGGNTYYAIFAQNATVHYTVKHYQEELNGTYPSEPTNSDEGTGVFGLNTTATARSYDGFTAQPFSQEIIKEDETTVVRIEYKRNTHSLTWNGNGGTLSGGTSGNSIKFGAPITEPTPARTGYTFFGWGTAADANETVTIPATMPDNNLAYYAIWKINKYVATFYLNNGTNDIFINPEIEFGTAISEPAGRPRSEDDYDGHHDFIGWSKTPTGNVITNGDFGTMTTAGAKFYAIWQIHSNTLAWDANGGNALTGSYTSGNVDYGTAIVKPNTPTRAGYTFMGWATSADGTPTTVLGTMPDEALTYYAIWQINSHNITWNTNGGEALTGDYTSGSVNYGTTITKPADPTRYGHDFKGWATSAEATTAETVATTMPDNDLTYYAVWDAHKHNLKWYPNGGEFTNGDPSGLVAFGTAIEMPMVNRTDWKMAGWATSANATPNDVETPAQTMPDNDLTYYAIWILKTNYVTWKRNYSENDDANFTATPVEVGNAITAPSGAPTREHYQFIGWSATRDGDVITDGNYGTMDENKKEFYARWELNKNTLIWDANGGTIVTSGTTGLVEYGAAITEPTVERNGYTFKGWGATAAATENDAVETTTMPDAATTYYAIWSANAYDVTWMKNDGTNEITTVTQVAFDSEIQAPSENPAREHYRFIGWAATPEGEVTADFGTLTTEGATFYAKWELRKYTLGWDANDGELSGDYTPAGDVEYGTPIVVPTATRTNYIHAGWGTSVKPDSSVNITTMPDSAVTYVAIWTNDNIEWRYNFEPDGNYTATTANIGEQIVPPVDPERPNYQFLGWSDAADGDIITDFGTMDSDHKIFYAQWQIHSNTLTWNANGGELSGDYTQGSVEFGTEIVRPVAEREGYTFNGWNTFAEAVDSISISTMPDNDVEYFAVWKVNKYAIAWMMNNGTDSVFATANVNYADTIKAPQTQPERTDYNFKGWAATETGSAIDSFGLMPAANTTFYAVWAANLFDAYWMVNDGTQAVFATTQASVSTTLVAPDSIPSRAYYTFKGWSTTATGEPMSNIEMPEGGITLYAVWASNEFTAIWKMNDGTDNNFETMKVEMGQTITAPAKNPTRQYYEFVGWSKTAQGSVTTDFGTMTADGAEFFAIWDAIVEFNAPETFVTCEREQNIELGGLSNKEIKFTWKVNDKVDATQTGTTFDIPEDAAFSGTITVTGSFGGKDVTKSITYQRKKMMTRTLWDDVITVANPDTTFVSYRWYHNGTLVDTTEYYNEVGGLTGKYYLIATTESGTEICSCESYFGGAQEATMTVYPNPTVDDVTVAGSLIEAGATISVIDGNGKEWLRKTVETDGSETVNVSQMPQGMYIVKVGDKVVSFIKL